MRFNLFLGAVLSVLALGCSETPENSFLVANPAYPENNDKALDHITATKVAEFGAEEGNIDAVFGSWISIAVNNAGTVFVLDMNLGKVKAFADDGTFLWSRLNKGSAPGEISQPQNIYANPTSGFHVVNQSGTQLDFFTDEAVLINSYKFETLGLQRPAYHGQINDSTFVFSKFIRGHYASTISIWVLGENSRQIGEFVIDMTDGVELDERLVHIPYSTVLDGMIVTPDVDEFKFRVYDLEGLLVKEITRNLEGISGPVLVEMAGGYSQNNYSSLGRPDRLSSEWIYGTSSWVNNVDELLAMDRNAPREEWPTPDRETTLDFYSNDFRLVYSLNETQQKELLDGNIFTTDGKGHIYAYSSSTGTISKYKVDISE